jgi:hypothetical protein
MNTNTKQALYWTPRVLGILLALLMSVVSMDVFDEGYGFWETIGALLLHLIPAFIAVIALAIAWRRERIGGFIFIAMALFLAVPALARSSGGMFILPGLLLVTGVLFLFNWKYRAELLTR